jgi:hypothetical protein
MPTNAQYFYIDLVYRILQTFSATLCGHLQGGIKKIRYNYISVRTITPLINFIKVRSMEHTKAPINFRWIPNSLIAHSPVSSD